MSVQTKYQQKTGLLVTSISGGRQHYGYRHPVKAIGTYNYELSYGENYHSLSAVIFGSDEYYYILDDINPPRDVFSLQVGDVINLPTDIVRNTNEETRIF